MYGEQRSDINRRSYSGRQYTGYQCQSSQLCSSFSNIHNNGDDDNDSDNKNNKNNNKKKKNDNDDDDGN